MELRVLGPVELRVAGQAVEVGPTRQRTVLAALAVDAGRPVQVDALIDRVWSDAPPRHARHTLQVYLSRLRPVLAAADPAGTGHVLVRRSGGYLLDIDPRTVDLHRFRYLVDQARNPAPAPTERVDLLRQALDLWAGPPLADLPGAWPARQREGWQLDRIDAALGWARLMMDLGQSHLVVDELIRLANEYPIAEPLVAALMRALCGTGQSAEALYRYDRIRRRLADELGVDPGPELQQLHAAILRRTVDNPVSTTSREPAGAVVPAQLPLDVPGFTGREEELRRLDAIAAGQNRQSTAVVISAVWGTAGVGKTALAVHWAHRVRHQFPDGQLYVNLRGFVPSGTVMTPAAAIRRFLDALGVEQQRIPADLDAQAALYRTLLADKKILVVLDNARDPDQVRPLLPGTPGCLVVVTSRNQLSGLVAADGAHPITLDLLTQSEAQELLAHRLGSARVAGEPDAVDELITRCARLPLALAVASANAAAHPHLPLHTVATELRNTHDRLDILAGGDPHTDIRAVFSWSYRALTPPAARLFRLFGLLPGPDIAAPATASLAGIPASAVRRLLSELTRASLIVEHTPGRYTFHDLLRAYAIDLTHTIDTDQQRHAATQRILDHYLHTAHAADRLLYPARDPLTLTPPRPGVNAEHLTDHQQALDWFTTERPVLLATVDHAAATGFDTHTWQLTWTIRTFLHRRGHWHDQAAAGRAAVAAAGLLVDSTARARAHLTLASAHIRLDRFDDAHTHLRHALDLYRRAGDQAGEAHIHYYLAHLWERQGRPEQALDHARQSLHLCRVAGHQVGQASALNAVGWYHALLGNYQQAFNACQQSLTLHRELDDRDGQANTWDSLGYAHHHLGHHTQAITCYQQALKLYQDLGNRYNEADTLTHLGDTHHATGNAHAARDAWRQALTILTDLEHPDTDTVRTKILSLDSNRTH
jgi:DNA-binding SARP family transcriptional activator/tetratricopeptide (TPR) repeat protein